MIRHPAGSAARGRDSGESRPICTNSAKSPLNWMKGWYFGPHESAVARVEISSGYHEKFRRRADPPSGWFCGEVARFKEIPTDLPEFSQISTYLVWKRGISRPTNLRLTA